MPTLKIRNVTNDNWIGFDQFDADRMLTAGSYLSGGGDLSANRRFDVDAGVLGSLLAGTFYTETEVDTFMALAASKSLTLTGGTGIAAIGDLSADRHVNVDQTADLTWTGQETFSGGGHRFHKSDIAFAEDQFITDYGSQPGLGSQANTKRYFNSHYTTTAMSMLSESYSVQPTRGSIYHTTKGVANVFSAYVALDTAETAAEVACYYGLTHLKAAGTGSDPLAAVADWWLNIDVDNAAIAQIITVNSKVASPTQYKSFLYMKQDTVDGYNQPMRRAWWLRADADESIMHIENRAGTMQGQLTYLTTYDYVKLWLKGKIQLDSYTNVVPANGEIWYDGSHYYGQIAGATVALDGVAGLGADDIKDTHIDWGTGANQVSGVDIPLADADGHFTTDNVEAALDQLGDHVADSSDPHGSTLTVTTKVVTPRIEFNANDYIDYTPDYWRWYVNNTLLYNLSITGFWPEDSAARDLGKTAQRWKDLYLSGVVTAAGMADFTAGGVRINNRSGAAWPTTANTSDGELCLFWNTSTSACRLYCREDTDMWWFTPDN